VQFDVNNLPTNTEVQVTWTPPEQPNGIITVYEVIHSVYDATTSEHRALQSNVRNYTIRNLSEKIYKNCICVLFDVHYTVPGTPYQVRVVAYNRVGLGVLGDYKVFFSEELAPTKAPENIQIKHLNATSVNVTWTPLTLFEAQGFPKYIVSLSPLNSEGRRRKQTNPTIVTSNSYAVFTNLDTSYSVSVSVSTGDGSNSVMSNSKFSLH